MTNQPDTFVIRTSQGDTEPDWGATDEKYRLWRARQAVEQAEKLLASEAATLSGHEARATTLLGWLSAEVLAAVGLVTTHSACVWLIGTVLLTVPALVSGYYLAKVFRAKTWTVAGLSPSYFMQDRTDPSELTTLEAIARVYAKETARNELILAETIRYVRWGWRWFLAIPVVGLAYALIIGVLNLL
ncbi:hypothetical protein [Acetobacter sp.]|uniref:hypothetical protein n=1 Tax=Acetobacter sp. TaxID=440 RepID=UPI0039EC5FCC